jgi:hypothetical protein
LALLPDCAPAEPLIAAPAASAAAATHATAAYLNFLTSQSPSWFGGPEIPRVASGNVVLPEQ